MEEFLRNSVTRKLIFSPTIITMPYCRFISRELNVCGNKLLLSESDGLKITLLIHDDVALFFHIMMCSSHHRNFVCKVCEDVLVNTDYLYGHIVSCCCGHADGSSHLRVRECEIYETEQIKQMIDAHNRTNNKCVTTQNIVLCVSTAHLRGIFPQFMYLQINTEMFKKMDIGNIDFLDGILAKNLDCYTILCEVWSINYVIRSIAKEFARSSAGLDFLCSVPGCRMVYNCFPDMKMINIHIITHMAHSPMTIKKNIYN